MTDFEDILTEALASKITITYPSGKTVRLGQELTPTQVKDEPEVTWQADPNKYYTLLMFDPDAPSGIADVQHWLVVNILGNDVKNGEVIAEYIGSGPPEGTGLHRYVFLVYEQKGKLVFNEIKSAKNSVKNRLGFPRADFKKKYELGKAIAGDYYKAKYEPFVDELRKTFIDL